MKVLFVQENRHHACFTIVVPSSCICGCFLLSTHTTSPHCHLWPASHLSRRSESKHRSHDPCNGPSAVQNSSHGIAFAVSLPNPVSAALPMYHAIVRMRTEHTERFLRISSSSYQHGRSQCAPLCVGLARSVAIISIFVTQTCRFDSRRTRLFCLHLSTSRKTSKSGS